MAVGSGDLVLPGFRFFPTDEELVGYYLRRKAFRGLSHDHVIADLDLYNFEPWDLPGLSVLKSRDGQWFFFAPWERQRPGNTRNSRATKLGYWKTTGKDRKIPQHCTEEHPTVGLKKTLVYYQGRAPHGVRTDWVMHEYRIAGEYESARSVRSAFVVCKVFKKGGPGPRNGERYGALVDAETETEIETETEARTGTTIEIEIEEEKEDWESHPLPVTSIPAMAAIKQEEKDLLAFLNRPSTASRLMQPAPALSLDVATKISETHLTEENAWPDPAESAVADELFADLPSLGNNMLFSDPSNHHMWASSSGGGGEEEGSVLAEMLQTAKSTEQSASKQEGGQGNKIPDLPFYYNYYYPTPPPLDFAEVEDLTATHHRDAAILAESTMMVKPAAQYSFHQPPSAPSEVRPELLHNHYFQLDCFSTLYVYLLIVGSENDE